MKRLLIPFMMILFISAISCKLSAQKDKKNKTVTLKIEKETDSGNLVIDTTFTLKEGEDLHKILKKYVVKADVYPKHGSTYDVEIELNDSLQADKKGKMVWVTAEVNDDNKKYKSKQKHVVIVGDDDVEIIKIRKGKIGHESEFDENVMIEEIEGDSLKITEKIIIRDAKEPKHKKIKKIYKFKSDSTSDERKIIFYVDDVIIKNQITDNDSIEVIVKKMKHGKHGKQIYISTDDNFDWTSDEDIHFSPNDGRTSKVKVEIIDPAKEDLKKLKLKDNYNKLDISNLFLFPNKEKDKMDIKFTAYEKGNLSLKIFDESGKVVFKDDKKGFEGKYKNEIDALKGTFYLQIGLGNKYYLKKMILDYNNK